MAAWLTIVGNSFLIYQLFFHIFKIATEARPESVMKEGGLCDMTKNHISTGCFYPTAAVIAPFPCVDRPASSVVSIAFTNKKNLVVHHSFLPDGQHHLLASKRRAVP